MSARRALVTGCSSGIGLGVACALAQRGFAVTATVRDPMRAPPALAGMEVIALDLADETSIARAAACYDHLDCLVNNAGYGLNGPFASYTAAQMRRQMEVNFLGPALLTQSLLPALAAARGRVINVSSLSGEVGVPLNALYCASKFALEGWAESLRHELAAHGIQVALVEPGGFRTRFAANLQWGARASPADGPDAQQLAGYRAMQQAMLARPGRDPAAVVAAVVRLALCERMPLRTRVGGDARLVHVLRRVLPERVASALLGCAMRRRIASRSAAAK